MKHIYSRIALLSSLLLIATLVVKTANGNALAPEPESSLRKENLRGEDAEIVFVDENDGEGGGVGEEEEEGEEGEALGKPGSNKFSWKYHHADHSIYAGRSLYTTANIKHDYDEGLLPSKPTSTDEYAALKTSDYPEKEWNLMFRALDEASSGGSGMQQILRETDLFEQIVGRLTPECRRDIFYLRDSAKQQKLWALRMMDAYGQIPSGITYGRFASPGDYEECINVRVDETAYYSPTGDKKLTPQRHKFHGKYCLFDFRLPMPERPKRLLSVYEPVLNLTATKMNDIFPSVMNYSAYTSMLYDVGYMHAFCVPSTCDKDELMKSIGVAVEGLHLIVNNTVDCEEIPDERPPLRFSQWLSIFILGSVALNAICATIIHYQTPTSKSELEKAKERMERGDSSGILGGLVNKNLKGNRFYTECFSIQTNFGRLTKPDPRGLTFVHYTRIVAMALTVLVHTGALGTLQAITKPADASNSEGIFRDFIPQMLANAFNSIQIFFFMAGFMLVVSTYPSLKRERGELPFFEYFLKRAIRLAPGLVAALCINFLWPLFADGPMLSYFFRVIVLPCEKNWWRTLLFLSNYDHVEKMCLRHSYFSASDYQLHLIAYPLLLLLYKYPTFSLIIAGVFTIAGFVAQVIMASTKLLIPFMLIDYLDREAFFNVVHYIHHPTWNHMSAFFYGYIIGYMVAKQIRLNISPATIKRIWLVLMPVGVASLFAPYFWNHYKRPMEKWQIIAYILIDRILVLTTCAWLAYASLVLARPAPKKQAKRPNINLPDIVSLERGDKKEGQQQQQQQVSMEMTRSESADSSSNKTTPKGSKETDSSFVIVSSSGTAESNNTGADSNRLKTGSPKMTRQRSSPDFTSARLSGLASGGAGNVIRPATSSTDLSGAEATGGASKQHQQEQQQGLAQPNGAGSGPAGGDGQSRPKRTPMVANVNTLCLVLSRLTFQLYLFNMVVLWVDVNNSKYYWFMSYYFIITKAFSVYITSSLIAVVFFVLMESPALSLYITWVKGRAEARAKRREQARQKAEQRSKMESEFGPTRFGVPVGAELNKQQVQLSYIDLSAPTTPKQ